MLALSSMVVLKGGDKMSLLCLFVSVPNVLSLCQMDCCYLQVEVKV